MPLVLYIMGTARSGSTILEILLAAGKGVFGAGELTSLVQDGFIEDKVCSCGKQWRQCEVWQKVEERLGLDEAELVVWKEVQKKVDWHDGFFRQIFGLVERGEKEVYTYYNRRLLQGIREKTGCTVVLDSSKYAGRALALSRIMGIEFKVICLTRSPSGLMASFQKPNQDEQRPKSSLAALMYYGVVLPSLRWTIWILGEDQVYTLCYERLVSDPVGVLHEIEQWSGIDLTAPVQRLIGNESFVVGHIVTGNRLRKEKNVFFRRGSCVRKPRGILANLIVLAMSVWQWLWRF